MNRNWPSRRSEVGSGRSKRWYSSAFSLRHSPFPTGFTLVEMLIVVTIVGLMASMVLPTLSSTSGAVSLEAMARTLSADLRVARQMAVQYNTSYSVTWNLLDNSYIAAPTNSSTSPEVVNPLSHGTSGTTIDFDQFSAGRTGQSHVVIGGAALKTSKTAVTNIVFGPSGGTGPSRTQDTVIWLQEGTSSNRRCILLTVSWITGAVTVGDVQSYSTKLTMPVF